VNTPEFEHDARTAWKQVLKEKYIPGSPVLRICCNSVKGDAQLFNIRGGYLRVHEIFDFIALNRPGRGRKNGEKSKMSSFSSSKDVHSSSNELGFDAYIAPIRLPTLVPTIIWIGSFPVQEPAKLQHARTRALLRLQNHATLGSI
jgi:hypothetical protein